MEVLKYNFEQRSEEWYKIRLGRVGGSEAIGLGTPARRKTLLYVKLAEVLAGDVEDFRRSAFMDLAIEREPIAIKEYEKLTFSSVDTVGYVVNSSYAMGGLSPDGLVGKNGAIEVKCLMAKNHIQIIFDNEIPKDYMPQVVHYFVIMPNLEWLDFVSYNPDVTVKPLHIVRVKKENIENLIKAQTSALLDFENVIQKCLETIHTS